MNDDQIDPPEPTAEEQATYWKHQYELLRDGGCCVICNGSGSMEQQRCHRCNGSGRAIDDIHAWIQTYTGGKFWPIAGEGVVSIHNIAHSLSLKCRWSGHCINFCSIARHSEFVAERLRADGAGIRLQLLGLLHDAHEAYLVDVPKPYKHLIPGWLEAEKRVDDAIYSQLGIEPPLPNEAEAIKHVDLRTLTTERVTNMFATGERWATDIYECYTVPVERHNAGGHYFSDDEHNFLTMYLALRNAGAR